MQWDKLQKKIYKKIYTKKTIEEKLQTDNAFLNQTDYHYLVASLGLGLEKTVYVDYQGQGLKRNNMVPNLSYQGNFLLEELSLDQAKADCSFISLIRTNEADVITVTYNSDTAIRAYLGEQPIPPLTLGYEFLISFMSNQKIKGYVLIQADLTGLGLVCIKGVMGSAGNEKDLRDILYNE